LVKLVDEEKIRKLVVCLGPAEPDCLISVFLAKLISLKRRLEAMGGTLVLAQVSEHTRGVFRAAGIEPMFRFYADEQTAVKSFHVG
jgi:anti-sigma B factor antagonist